MRTGKAAAPVLAIGTERTRQENIANTGKQTIQGNNQRGWTQR